MPILRPAPRTQTDARHAAEADTLAGAVRLFLRFATPRLLLLQLAVVLPWRLVLGGWRLAELGLAVAIAVYWPLQEWAAHIALLHLRPRTVFGWRIDPYAARAHRWHHRHPHVLERVFVPTRVIVVLIPIHAALWWTLASTPRLALSGMVFFTTAAVLYEWTHFLAHARYRPRSAWLQRVKRNHLRHHFLSERYWYAFTVPWVDTWLGTDPDGDVERSPTVRTLGVEDP